ncbi:MAG: ubiquinol-cytochrome C chaperone family protein [Aquabacterium sp.]
MSTGDTPLSPSDQALLALLASASAEDLGLLVSYLTSAGHGHGHRTEACRTLLHARAAGVYPPPVLRTLLAELQRHGDHNILKLLRKAERPSYLDIVRDVARHFKVEHAEDDEVETLESRILEQLMAQAWEKMSDAERADFIAGLGESAGARPIALSGAIAAIQIGGFAAYRIALFTAHALARRTTGRGLSMATHDTLERTVRALAGPVDWAVTAVWTAFGLANPAYRVTVPCVVQIAYMRRKRSLNICPACEAPNDAAARTCQRCGAAMPHAAPP